MFFSIINMIANCLKPWEGYQYIFNNIQLVWNYEAFQFENLLQIFYVEVSVLLQVFDIYNITYTVV